MNDRYDKQLQEVVEERDAVSAMLAGKGWEIFNGWMQTEVDLRRNEYEQEAPHGMNDTYITGFRRAQLTMLRTIQDMPQKLVDACQDAIDQIDQAEDI